MKRIVLAWIALSAVMWAASSSPVPEADATAKAADVAGKPDTAADAAAKPDSAAPAADAVGPSGAVPADPGSGAPAEPAGGVTPGSSSPSSLWVWQKDPNQPGNAQSPAVKGRFIPGGLGIPGAGNEMHLRGWVNMGFNSEGNNYGETSQDYRSTLTEVGGDLAGVLYHRAFLSYGLTASWVRDSSSFTAGSGISNGLQYNGSLNFLSERPYAFTLYFLRNSNNTNGSLATPFTYTNQNAGIRGRLMYPEIALISYQYEQGQADTVLRTHALGFDDHYRNANVTAERSLAGFTLTASDDYFHDLSHFSDQGRSNNFARLRVGRKVGEDVQIYGHVFRSDFDFNTLGTPFTSKTHVTGVDGGVDWKLSERLRTYASASLTNNALNTVELASLATGLPAPPGTLQQLSLNAQSKTFMAGASYSATSHLSFSGNLNYMDSGVPAATLATLSDQAKQGLVSSSLAGSLAGTYTRSLLWMNNTVNAGLTDHRYNVVTSASAAGLDWFASDTLSGGTDDKVRYGLHYGYSRNTNPVFFTLLLNQDHMVGATLETRRFRFAHLSGDLQWDHRTQSFTTWQQKLNNYSYRINAVRRTVTGYYAHSSMDANQLLFGLNSPLLQPGGSIGAQPLPPSLLRPLIYTTTRSDIFGAALTPRSNLRVESRYMRGQYSLVAATLGAQNYWSWDTSVQYKFGRFDLSGGVIKLNTHSPGFLMDGYRVYFRIHIPFQVF